MICRIEIVILFNFYLPSIIIFKMFEYRTLIFVFLLIDFLVMMWNFYVAPGEMYGKSRNLYKVTKTILLPTIFMLWIFYTPAVDGRIILYYFFQWLGDIVLLIPSMIATALGGVFFLVGHISMIQFFAVDFKNIPYVSYLFALPPALIMFQLVFTRMKFNKLMDYGCLVYCSTLQLAAFAAATRLSRYTFLHPSFLCSWIGYLFFVSSDICLILNEFNIVQKLLRIPIMSTYTIAQTLITVGAIYAEKDIIDINTYFQ